MLSASTDRVSFVYAPTASLSRGAPHTTRNSCRVFGIGRLLNNMHCRGLRHTHGVYDFPSSTLFHHYQKSTYMTALLIWTFSEHWLMYLEASFTPF